MKNTPNPTLLRPEEDPELEDYLKQNDWLDFEMPETYFSGLEKQIAARIRDLERAKSPPIDMTRIPTKKEILRLLGHTRQASPRKTDNQ